MIGCTLNGRCIFEVARYLINSNSPSGGINDIVLSESNLPSFTHWWNWQSSRFTLPALAFAALLVWSRPLELELRKREFTLRRGDCQMRRRGGNR